MSHPARIAHSVSQRFPEFFFTMCEGAVCTLVGRHCLIVLRQIARISIVLEMKLVGGVGGLFSCEKLGGYEVFISKKIYPYIYEFQRLSGSSNKVSIASLVPALRVVNGAVKLSIFRFGVRCSTRSWPLVQVPFSKWLQSTVFHVPASMRTQRWKRGSLTNITSLAYGCTITFSDQYISILFKPLCNSVWIRKKSKNCPRE